MANSQDTAAPGETTAFSALPTDAPVVLFEQRTDGSFVSISPRIEDWTGYAPAAWLSAKDCPEKAVREGERAWRNPTGHPSGTMLSGFITGTFQFRHATTGQIRSILEIRQPLIDAKGRLGGYAGTWWDLTPAKLRERRLRLAHESEILRLLTSGFVHDLNNVFLGISSYAELALAQDDGSADSRLGYLRHIRENAARAIRIVQRLSQLLPRRRPRQELHDFRTVTEAAMETLRMALPRRLELRTATGDVPLPVRADAAALQWAICALVLNAMDAIAQRGIIEVATFREESIPAHVPWAGTRPPGPMICLRVKDSGTGFPEIDPWQHPGPSTSYSTKPGRAGLGIGLAMVQDLAQSLGGDLSIVSAPGSGADVRCWLALADLSEGNLWPDADSVSSGLSRVLLAARSAEEPARWKPRLLEAGISCVIATKNPLRLLSENLEVYDAVVFPIAASDPDGAWRPVADQIRAQKHRVRLVGLLTEAAGKTAAETWGSVVDLILSAAGTAGDWREALSTLSRPPS